MTYTVQPKMPLPKYLQGKKGLLFTIEFCLKAVRFPYLNVVIYIGLR